MSLKQWLNRLPQRRSEAIGYSRRQTDLLRTKLQQDPFYRLQSLAEVAIAVELGIRIDANRASVDDWLRLPGLSIHQARAIVGLTKAGVLLHSLEDLAAAIGVSLSQLQPLAPLLLFCHYDPDSLETFATLNPNLTSIEQLASLPPIDLFLARAIVQNRLQCGNFRSLADLQTRLALPNSLTADLLHYLHF